MALQKVLWFYRFILQNRGVIDFETAHVVNITVHFNFIKRSIYVQCSTFMVINF